MGVNGRAKGGRAELYVAKTLNVWARCPEGADPYFYKRRKEGHDIAGPEWWPFCIECKDTLKWDFKDLWLFSPKVGLACYWSQAARQAELQKKIPLLVIHRNFLPWSLVMTEDPWLKLCQLYGHEVIWDITWLVNRLPDGSRLYWIRLEEFCESCDVGLLKDPVKRRESGW